MECRSCGAPCVWVMTEARPGKRTKRMPLDADPLDPTKALVVPGGNIVFTGVRLPPDDIPQVRYQKNGMHVSHFATCPNADAWRRRK